MILGGDLGGTKTLLALAEVCDGRLTIVRQQRFASQDYPSFDTLFEEFLADRPPISAACFGVAGPTDGHTAQLTYLPWQLSARALEQQFGIASVALINDFAAAAQGLPLVGQQDILTLLPGDAQEQAPRVILGAGTGLGVAGLVWQDGRYRVIPGEGGHFGFAPQTAEQGELWRWLLDRHGRVTVEDVVSGPGLAKIYAFLSGKMLSPETVGESALNGSDPLGQAALQLWMACYGAFAGDLAMQWLARGGVYLAGGLAAKLLPHVDTGPLTQAFLAKREHAGLVGKMPLRIVMEEELGLLGTLAQAAAL